MKKPSSIMRSMRITTDNRYKKLLVSLALAGSLIILAPALASADDTTCTQVYGGGVVCGAAVPEHKPIPTGVGDNLAAIGSAFVLASGVLLYLSKKAKKSFSAQ